MKVPETVRLLDAEPDLMRFMNEDDVAEVGGLAIPVVDVAQGVLDVRALLRTHRAFGVILLDGLLLRHLAIGDVATLRLLAPGDALCAPVGATASLGTVGEWRVAAPARLGILGREVLVAACRAPRLVAGLQERAFEQSDRVGLQLAICQLPRVEDRILAMLWLLAESWGQVTVSGTALRLHLTHETLGALVGARRSTVTLALTKLSEDGAILRQERGWLLLERPPGAALTAAAQVAVELAAPAPGADVLAAPAVIDVAARAKTVREATVVLRDTWDDAYRRLERGLRRLDATRRESVELRAQARVTRRLVRSTVARLHHHDHTGDAVGTVHRETDHAAAERLAAPVDGVED